MSEVCTIATRGSKLSLVQAHAVQRALERAVPGLEVRIHVVRTKGDAVLDKPLHKIGGKGLFTKELERALVTGEADLCVHSMKDVPTELAPGCAIAAVLPRADVRDVLVVGPRLKGVTSLAEVPAGARIGTGSLRRIAQIRANFPQVVPTVMRGNVDTRLAKAAGPDYEGAVLAAAGVERIGRADCICGYIPTCNMVPAAGQGAIGVEVRANDERAREWCARINDEVTASCVAAERLILAELGGSCKVPLGAYARWEGGSLKFDAIVLSPDGSRVARSSIAVPEPAASRGLVEQKDGQPAASRGLVEQQDGQPAAPRGLVEQQGGQPTSSRGLVEQHSLGQPVALQGLSERPLGESQGPERVSPSDLARQALAELEAQGAREILAQTLAAGED